MVSLAGTETFQAVAWFLARVGLPTVWSCSADSKTLRAYTPRVSLICGCQTPSKAFTRLHCQSRPFAFSVFGSKTEEWIHALARAKKSSFPTGIPQSFLSQRSLPHSRLRQSLARWTECLPFRNVVSKSRLDWLRVLRNQPQNFHSVPVSLHKSKVWAGLFIKRSLSECLNSKSSDCQDHSG